MWRLYVHKEFAELLWSKKQVSNVQREDTWSCHSAL